MEEFTIEKMFAQLFPFWKKLNEEQRRLLISHSSWMRVPAGQLLHSGSAECTGGIFVKKGTLRAYLLSEDGREVTLYRLYPGDLCMLSASCVFSSITFDVFVESEEESDCLLIGGKAFADLTKQSVYAENFALNQAVERFSDVMWVLQQILFMRFDRRLAIFLMDEMVRTGSPRIHGTQEQIAKLVGSAREVVSRTLKYFASEGIVQLSRGGVQILDKEKLRKLTL